MATQSTSQAAAASEPSEAVVLPKHEWSIPLPSRFADVLDTVKTVDANPSATEDTESAEEAEDESDDEGDEEESDPSAESETDESEENEDESEEDEGEEETEESEEDEEEAPASRKDGFAKMQKRIDKVTARAKSAEEERDKLRQQIELLSQASAVAMPGNLPALNGLKDASGIPSLEDLAKLEAQAAKIRDWAKPHRRKGVQEGEEFYSAEDVQALYEDAVEDLEKGIPFYRQFHADRAKATVAAAKAFPEFFGDAAMAAHVRRTAEQSIPGLAGLSDRDLLAGALLVGLKVATGKARVVANDLPRKKGSETAAGAAKPKPKVKAKPLSGGATPPPAGVAANLEALRKAAETKRTPEAFAAYRAAKREAEAAA